MCFFFNTTLCVAFQTCLQKLKGRSLFTSWRAFFIGSILGMAFRYSHHKDGYTKISSGFGSSRLGSNLILYTVKEQFVRGPEKSYLNRQTTSLNTGAEWTKHGANGVSHQKDNERGSVCVLSLLIYDNKLITVALTLQLK